MGLFSKRSEGASMNISEKLVNDFISKSEGLTRILEKETQYFRDMKMKQAEMLIETKISLIEEIEGIKTSLTSNPTLLGTLGETEKQKLRSANENLIKAATQNYDETLKAKEVNKIILEAIADAVSQGSRVEGAYSEKGSVYSNNGSASPVTISQNA